MKLTKEDVMYVADLARLEFNEEEIEKYVHQLGDILNYEEQLNELDTTGVEPTAHVLPIKNVLREDVPVPSLDREKALMNAPEKDKGCFKVPKVIE
ncbi:Asp-tRNA(Asn)/Glu-tRNA(Gln) amidotransferase subunit GatC [Alkalibacter saccharofermentans]|jgi:aspartyl-tRNA(Asn)/glutamyl-tRNA(Gln) amidotransferase subunit C|uniref:Aspartyl/glutamyl-tRNA(Asn/Gln) amidotransferase subunit C n=1 Tax=Alkalibacter saccharofermentans DSM 14828 TaxID=1120975 RepID=A0A1M4ZLZ7_9FIRM|nr:Asp-tRNA(Asn)/Glu-tRNA(Gln) amidotransferase subunit GatC [Alkalibacter saccharofermentans]SHF19041.1 aspartyl/glutamyl-tRNA(Asn/Gln) amidotransferase subunit C [Alkalibacter saccharofermentans DSM 14828]